MGAWAQWLSGRQATKGLNEDMAEGDVGASLVGALASAMGVEEGGVHLVGPGWKGVAAPWPKQVGALFGTPHCEARA